MFKGLGYTAGKKRIIKDGSRYNSLIVGMVKNTNPIINQAADTYDTVKLIKDIVNDTLPQTKKLSDFLWSEANGDLNRFLFLIWKFLYDHVDYELDSADMEQLREPVRTWRDKKADCDCYSLFISSVLTNKGIPHSFRIVKMNGKSYFQHIYIVVPKNGKTFDGDDNKTYYTLDCVVDNYNYEPPGITFKTDIKMTIQVQRLNGFGNTDKGFQCIHGAEFTTFGNLRGLGLALGCCEADKVAALHSDFNNRLKQFFINSREAMVKSPSYLPGKAAQYIRDVNGLLSVWNDENAKINALETLSKVWSDEADNLEAARAIGRTIGLREARIKKVKGGPYLRFKRGVTVLPNGIIKSPVEGEISVLPHAHRMGDIQGQDLGSIFSGLGSTDDDLVLLDGYREDDEHDLSGVDGPEDIEEHYLIEGLDGLGKKAKISFKPKNVFKAATKAVKTVNKKVIDTHKKVGKKIVAKAKKDANKFVKVAKKVGKLVVKFDPLASTIRAGLLFSLALNMNKSAEKLIVAYGSKEQAAKIGIGESDWKAAKDKLAKVEKLFADKLQGSRNNMRKAIFKGKKAKRIANKMGLNGLGVIAATTITLATTIITAVAGIIKSLASPKVKDMPGDNVNPEDLPEVDVNATDASLPENDSTDNSKPQENGTIVNDIENSSDKKYQDHSSTSDITNTDAKQDSKQTDITDSNSETDQSSRDGDDKKNNTGLIVGILAVLGVGVAAVALKPKRLNGLGCNDKPNIGEVETPTNSNDVTELSGSGNRKKRTITMDV
ncbi:MAG: hypothetical protein PSX81_02700 [bacterium]|nr:hypothetical protein [bacterium]